MDGVRVDQAEDLRAALRRMGPTGVADLSNATDLAVFTVKCRLSERPDWFRRVGADRWELVG